MSWERMSDNLWICSKCGKQVRIIFRMDDWNRTEYMIIEDDLPAKDSISDPSPPVCKNCGLVMDLSKSLLE